MNCIIVDDDATSRLIIKQLCVKSEKINVVDEFSSAIDAMKFLNNNKIDLIYLDIHMPSFSGFDFMNTISSSSKIILTTADKDLAVDAFEYKNVVDYLLKPITKERFDKSLDKLFSIITTSEVKSNTKEDVVDYIYVNVDKRLVNVYIPDIYLIEAKGDYINIKTDKKNYIVHSTLKKIGEKLPSNKFFKVHRSFIINFSEVIDIEDNTVLIRKDVVPISRSNKGELMTKLNLL